MFDKLHKAVHDVGSDIKSKIERRPEQHGHTHGSGVCSDGAHDNTQHRFYSFAPQRDGNEAKWFVDGCGYFWAVSVALEQAKESIWILDWWLSPELYLRRPPSQNEQYRLDRMLQAAAQRGVKVNIIVYKEVTQALTLSSAHTKHELESLHENIAVMRHPDHIPDQSVVASDIWDRIKNIDLTAANASKLPRDAMKSMYGFGYDDTVLYWAHHEKLCVIDGQVAFMGGLDMCYGRWDTNQHSIADVHPGDPSQIVFPGQDYNNARIMDFQDVTHWQNNKLDRTKESRMGWSDVSLCLKGPVVEDLKAHFAQRWDFIFDEKYDRKDQTGRYQALRYQPTSIGIIHEGENEMRPEDAQFQGEKGQPQPQGQYAQSSTQQEQYRAPGEAVEGMERGHAHGRHIRERMEDEYQQLQQFEQRVPGKHHHHDGQAYPMSGSTGPLGGVDCQITRSCTKWSHGISLEHSIANAYIEVIKKSEHFVYIENQFFITATSEKQKPIKNMIGAAMVERILRAARAGQKYRMIIVIPSVPAFAGDLRSEDSLATRAIMEFQYDSINRGGNSIYESIARAGFDPTEYIRFYNLRNYDRINASGALSAAQEQSGVPYEDARKQHDAMYGGASADQSYNQGSDQYNQYQQGAQQIGTRQGLGSGKWDSVASCYMLNGEDIRNVPWESGGLDEIDAFVSEELYIHSKLLIADDRVVICGSANLNDRSQLGSHDSEIAVIIQDPTRLDSTMDGRAFRASKFAASLRRQLFRKHLGLLPPQDYTCPDTNFYPLGPQGSLNAYDFGSEEDQQVIDPLSDEFLSFWNGRARQNTASFSQLFHPVPDDRVRTWKDYDDFYERFFKEPSEEDKKKGKLSKYKWGHVVAEEFPGGVDEVKEMLSRIRGTLVEMPLMFLKDEDIAKEGLSLNAFTEEVYT